MIVSRRTVVAAGGALLAASVLGGGRATAADSVDIVMTGTADGSRVWFDPIGVHVQPGQTVRWTNRDRGNSHTATSYHPDVFDRPRRIPEGAKPWDSDYLLPGASFSVTLAVEGVYDFYCVPHEHAGMVGRVVVGWPPPHQPPDAIADDTLTPLPPAALEGFSSIADILANGVVRRG